MKIRIYILLIPSLLLIYYNSVKSQDNQQTLCLTEQDCMNLYAPIIFSKGGLTRFFQNNFNRPEYAQDLLPHDFSHFVQCLDYTQRHFGTRIHGRHVMRIFTHKLRASPYVISTAFLEMLDNVIPIMKNYCDNAPVKITTAMKTSINKILYDAFLGQFDQFKQAPQSFFEAISEDITGALYDLPALLQDVTVEELRHSLTRFIDLGINKLIWSPQDGIKTWYCAKEISERIERMSEMALIDSDEYYDLSDSLLERYCLFLDLVDNQLPANFFTELGNVVANEKNTLLDTQELESCLETRRERFTRALCQGEFKIAAQSKGIVTS